MVVDVRSYAPRDGSVIQAGYVVPDIQRAMEYWSAALAIGPFFHIPHLPLCDSLYRGEPTAIDVDIALAYSGTLCFELIQQNDDAPSVFQEHVRTRGYGFHHWGVATRSFEADLARHTSAGAVNVSSCRVEIGGRSRAAFLDTMPVLGTMLELIELTPMAEAVFGMVQVACADWDGRDPVRVFEPS